MSALILPYQKAFSLPDFKRVLVAVAIVLVCSAVAGVVIQLAFQQFCTTRLGIILFSGTVFWTLMGPYIFDYTLQCYQPHRKFWVTVVGGGFGAVVLNQLFIYFSITFLMSTLYGCVDEQNNWLQNLLTNNVVINMLCYAGFVGSGIFTHRKKERSGVQEQREKKPTEHYLHELIIKNGSIATRVPVETIQWIEADDKCISITGENFRHVLYRSLKSIESELNPSQFIRIHRGTVINKNYLTRLHSLATGDALAEMKNGVKLRVSRNFKDKI
jgi:hypothetical protein